MNTKSYSYKPNDKMNPLKWLAVALTIAAMGFFVYTVYDAIQGDSQNINQSTDDVNRALEDYKNKYGQ